MQWRRSCPWPQQFVLDFDAPSFVRWTRARAPRLWRATRHAAHCRHHEGAHRRRFYAELDGLVAGLSIKLVACAFREAAHMERCGALAVDAYMLSLGVLEERFCFEIGRSLERGTITVECRGRQLDDALAGASNVLRMGGTAYVRPATINRGMSAVDVRAKSPDQIGLQLAHPVVSPIARVVLGEADTRGLQDHRIQIQAFARGPHRGSRLGRSAQRRRPRSASQLPTSQSKVGSCLCAVKVAADGHAGGAWRVGKLPSGVVGHDRVSGLWHEP